MTRQRHFKRLLYKSPKTWTTTETDAYHERMQELLEERARVRRAKQREILAALPDEEEEEE